MDGKAKVEVCAGDAKLSTALHRSGLRVKAFDVPCAVFGL